jgi:hypothetical protein
MPVRIERRQSLNLDCAVRREVKEFVRWVSSRSSWDFSSLSWGIGSWVRSTGGGLLAMWSGGKGGGGTGEEGIYFGFLGLVWTPWFSLTLRRRLCALLGLEVVSNDDLAKSFPVECGEIARRLFENT